MGAGWPLHLELLGRMAWACTDSGGKLLAAVSGCDALRSWEALGQSTARLIEINKHRVNHGRVL